MLKTPTAHNDPVPAVQPEPAPSAPLPLPPAAEKPGRIMAAGLAILAGVTTMVALTVAYVSPSLAPVMAPIAVIVGAAALWGAARVDHIKLRGELDRLARENRRLAASLESLADTAWELRESEEHYRSLIDSQGDLVIRRDSESIVTFVNAAFVRAFGVAPEILIGKPLSASPVGRALGPRVLNAGGEGIARDVRLETVSGPRWFSWIDIRLRDDKGTLGPVYSVARDITARKDVEQALVDARQKAEAASQAKSRVLATVSHEFRTPLNGILGLTGLILESPLTPDQETYARAVRSSGEALLGLVDDMLDFSKIEAGRLDLRPEPTDLETLLEEIAELLAPRAHAKGIDLAVEIDGDVPASVTVDATRLRQVLINLVGNGVKFTEEGGVRLSTECLASDGGRATIAFTVEDTGPGVSPEETERVFDEFEQVDAALSRRHGGAGLGLAISRRIVRRMGGDITLTPSRGGGSVFRFSLELAIAGARPHASPGELAGRHVLVLAPGPVEPAIIADQLMEAGADARVVSTIHEGAALLAAAVAARLAYEAVVVDARLAADPATILARLREAAGRPIASAVLIEPRDRGRIDGLREAGFLAYLVRPVRRSSLIRIIGEIAGANDGFRVDPGDATPRQPVEARRASRSLEILLAEDNEINALLARAVLEGLGHSVTEVRDGAAAVDAATERPGRFAAILMDLHMPGLDGLSAARAIRNFERESGAPRSMILAVTADVLAETKAASAAAGIDALIEKPITPDALRRLVAEATVT